MATVRSWSKRAGEVAKSYLPNIQELAGRREYTRMRRSVAMQKSRGVSKPVEAAALRIAADQRIAQLEREVEAVEWAFAVLREIRGGDDVAKVAAALYLTKDRISVDRVAHEQNMDRATAFRHNRIFLKLVAARLGLWAPQI